MAHRVLAGKPKRVEVEWLDSYRQEGWNVANDIVHRLDAAAEHNCWTTGYLIDDRAEGITVALSYTLDSQTGLHDEYGAVLTIPRCAVVSVRELRR